MNGFFGGLLLGATLVAVLLTIAYELERRRRVTVKDLLDEVWSLQAYGFNRDRGLSDYESRATAWPDDASAARSNRVNALLNRTDGALR